MRLYIHVQNDGGIFLLGEDRSASYVSKLGLKRRLDEIRRIDSNVLYSREDCNPVPNYMYDVFALIEDYKIPIQLVDPIPEVVDRPIDYVPPLIHAAYSGDHGWLQELIDWGVDLEIRDRFGQTALMMAADAGQLCSVRMLLQAGANPNATGSEDGSTPLMFAAQHGHAEIVNELVERGADAQVRGVHGYDAAGLARQNKHLSVIALLEGK